MGSASSIIASPTSPKQMKLGLFSSSCLVASIVTDESKAETEELDFYIPPKKINKLHPIAYWEPATPLTYRCPVNEKDHLNAYCKDYRLRRVEGVCVYSVKEGQIFPVGTHTIMLTFIPKLSFKYVSITASREIVVVKRRPVVTWSCSSDFIPYGTLLGDEIFSEVSCELPNGCFVFSHVKGMLLEIGVHTITAEYEPSGEEAANYCRGYSSRRLRVVGAPVPLHWEIPFDQELHDYFTECIPVVQSVGTVAAQKSLRVAHSIPSGKKSSTYTPGAPLIYPDPLPWWVFCVKAVPFKDSDVVDGVITYDIPEGSVLDAGSHLITAVFTPHDLTKYQVCSITNTVTILISPVKLVWPLPSGMTEGDVLDESSLNCGNELNVPGSYEYEPKPGTALLEGRHTLRVWFEPDDKMNYQSSSTSVPFQVRHKKIPCIFWTPPTPIVHPFPLSRLQLNAAIRGNIFYRGTFVYEPDFDTLLDAGEHILKATFYPSLPTVEVTQVTVPLTVHQGLSRLVWNTPQPIFEGEGLYDDILDCRCTNLSGGTFSYNPQKGAILSAGSHKLHVRYVPDDKNYMEVESQVELLVKAKLVSKYASY